MLVWGIEATEIALERSAAYAEKAERMFHSDMLSE